VHAAYYDRVNNGIITTPGVDDLTEPKSIGSVMVSGYRVPISFVYGVQPDAPSEATITAG
jgi:hypothetical protein